ncbi:MAG: MCP four helix bundle domain-containing protein, partial [Desulfamplus sp.]|nr:MCP four helix bundle domain-containing protein [Desulfamplus sp.]
MNWFLNMKIGKKLITVALLGVAGLAILGVYLLSEMGRVYTAANYGNINSVPSLEAMFHIMESTKTYYTRSLRHIINTDHTAMESIEKQINESLNKANKWISNYEKLLSDETDRKMLEADRSALSEFVKAMDGAIQLSRSNRNDEAREIITQKCIPAQATLAKAIEEHMLYNMKIADEGSKAASSLYGNAKMIGAFVVFISAILLFAIILFTSRTITNPVNNCVEAAKKIAAGNTDVLLDTSRKDETGVLQASMQKMVEAINALIKDISILSSAAIAGQLATRADTSAHKGDFGKIVAGVNETLDAVIKPLNVAAKYVDRISIGDLPPKIIEEYQGDFNNIKNNLNILIDAMNNITEVAQTMAKGDLMVTVKERSQGDKLMQALNIMISNLKDVVSDVRTAANNVSAGAREMSTTAEQMSQGATEQAASAEEASSSMEEMSANISQNAENAQQTERLAIQAANDAAKGGEAVSKTVVAMK